LTNSDIIDTRPAAQRIDLRRVAIDDVIARVEASLQVRLAHDGSVRKRRSIGFRSDRGSWVRLECRGIEKLDGQGWGLEAATTLDGVPVPDWYAGVSWFDAARQVMWRADENQLVDASPVGRARSAALLPEDWWEQFDAAMDALGHSPTTRGATPDCEPITVERVMATIRAVYPDAAVDVDEWAPAHADLTWANVTGPSLWILDWEDWGRAPRGLDAATLWFASLTVPTIAEKVRRHRSSDLNSTTGKTMMLFKCAELLRWANEDEPLYAPALREAGKLTTGVGDALE
jgi:hypothetical protein